MFPKLVRSAAITLAAAFLMSAPAPAAEAPTLMGSFKAWFVYSVGADRTRVCYALARPANSAPKNVRRDPIYILISSWPARGIRNEPSIVPGYPYKDSTTVEVSVGNDKFTLFTQNQGTNGGAWIKSSDDEARLIEAMKRGISMTVTGTSRRGTVTRDEYSLAGLSAALDAIANACR
jgi:hypothetical protein